MSIIINQFDYYSIYEPKNGPLFDILNINILMKDINIIIVEYIVYDNYTICSVDKCITNFSREFNEFFCNICIENEEKEQERLEMLYDQYMIE